MGTRIGVGLMAVLMLLYLAVAGQFAVGPAEMLQRLGRQVHAPESRQKRACLRPGHGDLGVLLG